MKRMARQLQWDVGKYIGGGSERAGGRRGSSHGTCFLASVISVYVGFDIDSRKGHVHPVGFIAVSSH
jgi:hypothetical protein